MEESKTPLADFLIMLSDSLNEQVLFDANKEEYLKKVDLSDRVKQILVEGDSKKLKMELYKEQNLDHELPTMYTMGHFELAKMMEEEEY